jgi:hypothetical protein
MPYAAHYDLFPVLLHKQLLLLLLLLSHPGIHQQWACSHQLPLRLFMYLLHSSAVVIAAAAK